MVRSHARENLMNALRSLAFGVATATLFISTGCAASDSTVLEKCKAETKVATCQTCCEKEGWQKGSVSTGECECSKSEGTGL